MKALLVLASAIAASILLVSAAIRAGEGDAQTSPVATRHFHARTTSFVEIHNGKKGDVGDLVTFTHSLTDRGRHVGRNEGYCVRILRRSIECSMTSFCAPVRSKSRVPF